VGLEEWEEAVNVGWGVDGLFLVGLLALWVRGFHDVGGLVGAGVCLVFRVVILGLIAGLDAGLGRQVCLKRSCCTIVLALCVTVNSVLPQFGRTTK